MMAILRGLWHLLLAFGLLVLLAVMMVFAILCAWEDDWRPA